MVLVVLGVVSIAIDVVASPSIIARPSATGPHILHDESSKAKLLDVQL